MTRKLLSTSLLVLISVVIVVAQPGNPPPPPTIPIDGGIGFLIAAGMILGITKIRKNKNP